MKKLSVDQFSYEHEYKQAKKRLKKVLLDQRTARGSRTTRTKRSINLSGANVPDDVEVMFYEALQSNYSYK